MATKTAIEEKLKGNLTTKKPNPISGKIKNIFKMMDIFIFSGAIERCILGLTKSLARLFVGAIVLVVLANFAPELRAQVPSLYLFVDWLLEILEYIYKTVCTFLHLY